MERREPSYFTFLHTHTHTHTHTHRGILLSHKEGNIAICTMDEPRDYHTEWSKSDRERQILYAITSLWNLKNETNESIYIDSQTQKTNRLPKGKGTGEGNKLGLWD